MQTAYKRCFGVIVAAIGIASATPALATNCCQVGSGSCNIIPPLTHGDPQWTGNVCGTTLSGTNCVAKLDNNVSSSSSSDCLTLGSGVTLDMNGYDMHCSATSPSTCGAAIKNTSSGGTSSGVVVENGTITGRWSTGISVTGGTNSSVTEMTVDGAGTGISGVQGTIDYTIVQNSSGNGIVLAVGKDVKKSILRDNGKVSPYGAGLSMPSGSYTGSALDDVMFVGNHWSINNQSSGGASIQRSSLLTSESCHCYASVSGVSACRDINYCINVTNSAVPTWVQDDLKP